MNAWPFLVSTGSVKWLSSGKSSFAYRHGIEGGVYDLAPFYQEGGSASALGAAAGGSGLMVGLEAFPGKAGRAEWMAPFADALSDFDYPASISSSAGASGMTHSDVTPSLRRW